jgi:hypothetical protein
MSSWSSYISTLLDGLMFTGKSTWSLASELVDWAVYEKMQSAPLQAVAVEVGTR